MVDERGDLRKQVKREKEAKREKWGRKERRVWKHLHRWHFIWLVHTRTSDALECGHYTMISNIIYVGNSGLITSLGVGDRGTLMPQWCTYTPAEGCPSYEKFSPTYFSFLLASPLSSSSPLSFLLTTFQKTFLFINSTQSIIISISTIWPAPLHCLKPSCRYYHHIHYFQQCAVLRWSRVRSCQYPEKEDE